MQVLSATLLALALLAAGPASAAAQSAPATLVEDDVRFAENLAKYGYYTLATDVLAAVKTRKMSAEEEGSVAFSEARILKRAADNSGDETLRLQLLSQVVDLLHDWATAGSAFAFHPRRGDALGELAAAYQDRGRMRARMAKDDPARADTLKELADKDFEQAHETYDDLRQELEKKADQASEMEDPDRERSLRNEAAVCFYRMGLNGLDWADVAKDPAYRLEKAEELLVEYQWALEEESLAQYGALHYQGVIMHHRALLASDDADRTDMLRESLEIQDEVLERAQWYWDNLRQDPTVALLVAEVFDRAWGEKAEVLADLGDLAAADAVITTMIQTHESAKQPFPRAGFEVLLDWAEVLRDSGEGGRSGEIIKLVADGAANLPQGERARRLLADIFAGGGASTGSSPSVLLAAARGLYDKGSFAEAAYVYESAAAAATSPADSKAVAADAWLGAGRSLYAEKRFLEAGIAYERALETAVRQSLPEDVRATAAGLMYNAYSSRFNETRDDFDKALRDKASAKLTELGIEGDIPFMRANETFAAAVSAQPQDAQRYRAAREEFEGVSASAPSYELALVGAARSLAGEGRKDEALAAFDAILRRAEDPALKPTNVSAQAKRDGALAQAYNYKAELLLDAGVNRPDEVLALLQGFEEKLPGQPSFIESVKALRVRAYCRLGRYEEAEKELAALLEFKPGSPYGRVAAFEVAQALASASEAARGANERERWLDLRGRAAEAMWTYNELSGFASFANLVSNGEWFGDVASWGDASRAYQKAVDAFDRPNSGISTPQLDEARLGLATALTELGEFGKARPYWQDLMDRRPSDSRVLRGAARGFGGWLAQDAAGNVTPVDGAGDYQKAFDTWSLIHQRSKALQPQSIWWESKLGAIYSLYRMGASQPQSLIDARKVLDQLRLLYPEYDETTFESLAPDQRYQPLFKPRFLWLDKKVPK